MKKTVIHKVWAAADTVEDLLSELENGSAVPDGAFGAEQVPETDFSTPMGGGKKVVSPVNVAAEDDPFDLPDDPDPFAPAPAQPEEGKKVVPPVSVAADDLDRLSAMLSGSEPLVLHNDGTLGTEADEPVDDWAPAEKKTIPKTTTAATGQWYERDPQLMQAEIAAMRREFGNPAMRPHFMEDGTMYWLINDTPNLGPGYHCPTYTLALVYDKDHPRAMYGTSVHVVPMSPGFREMQARVNRSAATPKTIPHTVTYDGNRCLCTTETAKVSTDKRKGVTSAVTSFRYAHRWLTIFELGLRHPATWRKFHGEGEI